MNNKVLIAIAAVFIVVIAALAVYFMFNGNDDNADPSPVLKETFEVGDYYTVSNSDSFGTMSEDEETTYTITGVVQSGYTVSETTNGVTSNLGTMTRAEFLSNIVPTDGEMSGMSDTGSVVLQTAFGKLRCDTWEGTITGLQAKVWICPDNGVAFRIEGSGDILGTSITSVTVLTAATIFEDGSQSGTSDSITVRTGFVVGDMARMDVWESRTVNGEEGRIDGYEQFTVDAIDGDNLSMTLEMDGETHDRTMTSDDFRRMLVPDLGGYTQTGQETVSTPWGDLSCDVYSTLSPNTGGFDKAPTLTYWVEHETGLMIKTLMSVDDAWSNGTHLDHWEVGTVLTAATMVS